MRILKSMVPCTFNIPPRFVLVQDSEHFLESFMRTKWGFALVVYIVLASISSDCDTLILHSGDIFWYQCLFSCDTLILIYSGHRIGISVFRNRVFLSKIKNKGNLLTHLLSL